MNRSAAPELFALQEYLKIAVVFGLLFSSFFIATTVYADDQNSVERAYEEIPHRRTLYQADVSTLPRDHSFSLEQMFPLVDRAVAQRVATLSWFRSGGSSGKTASSYNAQIRTILSEFDFLARPRELAPVRTAIVGAIEDQQAYFHKSQESMQRGGAFVFAGVQDPLIASSHKKIREALSLLKKMYPNESAHNRQAFEDHLGALDFVQK
jgi:hypothetical protein